jgi:very-short-patch-repair endonuclease
VYDRLEAPARRQHGLVTREQALSLGLSRSTWYRMLASARLFEVFPGVARLPGATPSPVQQILAAVLWQGPGAVVSHRSAASVWGADAVGDRPVDVIVARGSARPARDGVVVHRPTDRAELRPVLRSGVPVTNPLRTLLDLGAVAPEAVPSVLGWFITSGFVRPAAVDAAIVRHSRHGRHGLVALRDALAGWSIDGRPPDSELEVTMHRLVVSYGLPPVEFHARVAGYEVDFLVVDSPVVLECDGWLSHGRDREQFEFDRRRDADLTAAGYIVSHFTWRSLVRGPGKVANRIRGVIQQWAPHLLPPESGAAASQI